MGSTSRLRDAGAPLGRHDRISLSQKYQPKRFKEIVGQDVVVKYLLTEAAGVEVSPLYIFTGPRGTGKTSAARVFAAALNCISVSSEYLPCGRYRDLPCGRCSVCAPTIALNRSDAVVLDAASNFADLASMIRRRLKDSAGLKMYSARLSMLISAVVVIVEGCELLSMDAWSAVVKVLEEAQHGNSIMSVTFILISTDAECFPLPATMRCQRLHFFKVKESDIVKRLEFLAAKEGLIVEAGALSHIAAEADGSVRDAEMLLDQLCLFCHKSVSIAPVQKPQGFSEPSPACELSENLDLDDADLRMGRSSTLYGSSEVNMSSYKARKDRPHEISEPVLQADRTNVTADSRPHGVSEPLPTHSLSSTSGSRQDGPSKPPPVYKQSHFIIEDVVKQYTWNQVLHMTKGRTSRQLGKGGFGTVYLGKLENGKKVAVKILKRSSQQGIPEFLNEVNLLRRVNHVNLVRLLGYSQDEEQVLVYEFAEEGSIWDHLHGDRRWLDWKHRLSIAIQSACGLEYLHTLCSPRIIHRDIKSENILLTKTMIAKVCDFGSSRLGADQDNNWKTHVTTKVIGTRGYLDPEYHLTGQLRNSSDVYSFGIVLLEIITGRKPVPNSDPKCCISNWVEKAYGSGGSRALKAIADPTFRDNYDPKALKLVIDVARACIEPNGEKRPKISEVLCVLRKAQELEQKRSQSKWFPFL